MLSILVYDNVITSQIKNSNRTIVTFNYLQILITLISVIILFIIFVITLNKNSNLMIEQEKRVSEETKKAYNKLNKETQGMQIIHSVINSGPWSMEFNDKGEIEKCVWSKPFRQMIGYMSEEEFPNKLESWANLLHPDDKKRVWDSYWKAVNDYTGKTMYDVEYRLLTKNNGYRWYHAAGNLIRHEEGSPATYVGLFIDVDEKKNLKTLSETDQMTGLLNRVSGEKKVAELLNTGKGGLFILLDIDHFKFFNDTFGHGVGDKVIINVANCLKSTFRNCDIVFRLGGDEFAAYAQNIHSREIADKVIKRFIDGLKKISIPELQGNSIDASIGALVLPEGETFDFAYCYKLVDDGVYESKKTNGRSEVTFAKPDV
jgi:diguanylate cyclase (GGDEF)-like protein